MFFKKSLFLFLVILLNLIQSGCITAKKEVATEEIYLEVKDKIKAETLIIGILENLKTNYEEKNLKNFSNLLDSGFPEILDFKSRLEKFFIVNNAIGIRFILKSFQVDKEQIFVRVSWFRKYVDSYGVAQRFRKQGVLVFTRYKNELKLLKIEENNPFF